MQVLTQDRDRHRTEDQPSASAHAPTPRATSTEYSAQTARRTHAWCGLQEVADLLGLELHSSFHEDQVRFALAQFRSGQRLYSIGQAFDTLYVLRNGFMKSAVIDVAGNEQVLGFPMKGDLLGTDGIHSGRHESEAIALSDSVVICLPFRALLALGRDVPELEAALYAAISRDLVRDYAMVRMLTGLNAECRVARFLVALSQRYAELGYSGTSFNLRMTRHDIGRYLGLSMESVCRMLNAFAAAGLIEIRQREVVIRDVLGLQNMRRLKPVHA